MVLVAAVAVVVYRGTCSGKLRGTARYAGGETNAAIQTTYDAVTGLPTQRLFLSLLNQAVPRAHKQNYQAALLLVEMDHFSLDRVAGPDEYQLDLSRAGRLGEKRPPQH
ncbi:MAG: diguanylate cyclase [Nitrospiraceae bacterium]